MGLGYQEKGVGTGAEWNVVFGTRAITEEGDGWTLLHNGTLVVTGASANENVTILHYVFPVSSTSNLPFYQQQSVAITVVIVFVLTVAIAAVIKIRSKKRSSELTG